MTAETTASPASNTTDPDSSKMSRLQVLALAVLGCGLFLATLDFSIVYVALPSIGNDLALSDNRLQWVVSAYAILFAGFLLVGGRIGDRFGAGRVFLLSTGLFGIGSLAAGMADNFATLVIARAFQGIGAGLLDPSTLGLIQKIFPAGPKRNRAMAVWGAVGAIGLVGGVVLGGLLTAFSWKLIFFVNVPIVILVIAFGMVLLPKGKDSEASRPVNGINAALGTGAILSLVFALTQLGEVGLTDTSTLSGAVGFVVLAGIWVARERASENPLIARELWRTRSLMVACGIVGCYVLSIGLEFFLVTHFLQNEHGYGPLAAGIGFLPLTITVLVGNAITDRIIPKAGARAMVMTGLLVSAFGLALIAACVNFDNYAIGMLPGLLLSGLGNGIAFPALFISATSDIPSDHQGVGAAMLTTSQYVFSALGLAVLVLILGHAPDPGNYLITFGFSASMAVLGTLIAAFGMYGKKVEASS
ncbi:drug resistance transporter, EmrB/QacA subfamily [Actinopolyspora xinjiangensis]|uniref:Drug resistance transporter, EmrB/QacA subfamily n=1 Tax=Actinopolyspora xinjiangensis TaxID=405564 RepID=A0A1H0WXE2_9ACTN|nr:MFS transporter [Actinopolyspora xinjiangensis]SDP95259.1 drug resistance transporter, EmrB/QacA subfamily [Actinopolyspora xinjiangensis]